MVSLSQNTIRKDLIEFVLNYQRNIEIESEKRRSDKKKKKKKLKHTTYTTIETILRIEHITRVRQFVISFPLDTINKIRRLS